MNHLIKSVSVFLLVAAMSLLTGCQSYSGVNKSSLVEFLYPASMGYIETPQIPHLQLPLRVGIAFTPATQSGSAGFSEILKRQLAQNVADKFADLEFVSHIEIIPSDYLRYQGGFTNIDQLRQIFGVDVIVLLS